jgi:hypothetical protein
MKTKVFLANALTLGVLLVSHIGTANGVTLTTDTLIGPGDTTYDGQDVVVDLMMSHKCAPNTERWIC